jgi:transaldolase
MKYFLDTANIDSIKKLSSEIKGVTTNPFHFRKENIKAKEFLELGNDFIHGPVFIQVNTQEGLEELLSIRETYKNIVAKISMIPEYFPLYKMAIDGKIPIAATTIYNLIQLNQAIEFGCDYSMVYYYKNPDKKFIYDAYDLKSISSSNIILVGASFRTKEDVKEAIKAGMDYSTVRPDVYGLLFCGNDIEKELDSINQCIF